MMVITVSSAFRWWKRIGITLAVIGLLGIVWTSSIWYEYQRTLPHHPDQVAGRIYPLNVHGIVVYQTREERDWREEIQYSTIAIFATAALMSGIYQIIYEKKYGRPPW